MSRRTSSPDLARSIYLLWGHHPTPGRRGLRVSVIVEAGMAIADADGLEAVSMRRVADRLEVGTMTLYGHVPGKDDLVDLMIDTAYGELYDDLDEAANAGNWRDAMRLVAWRNWDLLQRHPWLLERPSARPVVGPNASHKYETEIRALDGIGLTDLEMDSALTLVLSHVDNTARAFVSATRTTDDSGMSDAQWWTVVSPVLDQVMAGQDLRVSGRVGTAVGQAFNAASADPDTTLAFGLETILDGIQARIDR